MRLSPHEQERLMLRQAADLARARRERGLLLNYPEAVAVLTDWVLESARDGRFVVDLMEDGRHVLSGDDVMDGVAEMLGEVQIEATFPDGTKLVTLHDPIGAGSRGPSTVVPGEIVGPDDPIEINVGRPVLTIRVENGGDRPIQVGSHYHLAEANPSLDVRPRGGARAAARHPGRHRRALRAGHRHGRRSRAVRRRPGDPRPARRGRRPARRRRRHHEHERSADMSSIDRARYRALYGPTTGDRIRLADTDIWIEVTEDHCVGGDEVVFGGGKVIRESMGQSTRTRAEGAPDLVITGAVILDHWGIVKADIGVRDGRIVGIGKAGNPDTMDGIHPALVIGPSTEILSGNGRIVTAGAIDCHVHLICPQLLDEALGAGITTIVGGGTGPAEGTEGHHGHRCLAPRTDARGRRPLADQRRPARQGQHRSTRPRCGSSCAPAASGFKLHEDWGTTPAAIDACLRVADASGVQVAIHTDTLNEAGYVESTLAAIAGRSIHTFHTEGAGGGHAPDIMTVASHPNVLPSSTNPTRPHTVNTVDEHLDMLMVCHHLNPAVPEDLAFADSRIRPSTIAAEDILHDMGAISMIGSDSQAMGRIGEVVIRTWQTAHVMKLRRGPLDGDGPGDNHRARRYVAKYTICPAITHGLQAEVGSVEVGKLADLVLWEPAFFGVRPHVVVKGGMIAWATMGDANASIPTPQPQLPRPMFGAAPGVAPGLSVAWVSEAAIDDGLADRLERRTSARAVVDTRSLGKADMPLERRDCPTSRSTPTRSPCASTANS